MNEHQHQVALIGWFRAKYPNVLIFAIPNGGLRNIRVAVKLKAEGVAPGVPDLFIPAWKLWVEMKTPKGKLSPHQKTMIDDLRGIGYSVIIGYGFQDAANAVERHTSTIKVS